jgi:uncharacterized protein (DUF305 family)
MGISGCQTSKQTQESSSSASDKNAELTDIYWAQQDSALNNYTSADVMFMTGMICHHAQALIMSRLAPQNNASEQVQTLAARIINAQKDEIETMQSWLSRRNEPVPRIEFDSLRLDITLSGKPYTEFRNMPGVLAQQKMQELAAAEGSEFDRLFLTYMIQHHRGAVVMVDNLFSKDGAAQGTATFRLASGIQADQRTEIDRMKLMLEQITGSG